MLYLLSSEKSFMKKQSLVELLHDLEQELLRLGYTKGTMKFIIVNGRCYFNLLKNKVTNIIINKPRASCFKQIFSMLKIRFNSFWFENFTTLSLGKVYLILLETSAKSHS